MWGAFAVDYLVRLALAGRRRDFVRAHWLDLCAVVLPMLQPLRLLRLVSTLMLVGRRARMASQIRLTTYVGGRGRRAADVRLAGRAVGGAGLAGREHQDAG